MTGKELEKKWEDMKKRRDILLNRTIEQHQASGKIIRNYVNLRMKEERNK